MVSAQHFALKFNDMVKSAEAIVEGKVISKTSFEHNGKIYTQNEVEIYSILKSSSYLGNFISIITIGGRIGDKSIGYSHVAHLNLEDEGIFMLDNSIVKDTAFRLKGEMNGYYRESNKDKGRYFSYAGYFDNLDGLKKEVFNITQTPERKMVQRGCLNISIDFDPNTTLSSDEIGFRLLASSDIPSTYLNKAYIPIMYDPSEYGSDPFDSQNIKLKLSQELAESYDMTLERLGANKVVILITTKKSQIPVLIGGEYMPIIEGRIRTSSILGSEIPHLDITKQTLLDNTKYTRIQDVEAHKFMWNCLNVSNNFFHEFAPQIDSIAPLNVAAGVGDMSENGIPGVITIYGSGFGTPAFGAFSAGTVGFPDAESIIPSSPLTTFANTLPAELDYLFWSDSIIRVRVPTRNNNTANDGGQGAATSGKVTVTVNGSNAISSQEVYVHFGMFNDYEQDSNGVIGAKKRRMSAQWSGISPSTEGYRLRIDQSVLDSIPNAIVRIEEALDEWRCNPDHPIWIEVDTATSGVLYTGSITMSQIPNPALAALTGIVGSHQNCQDISVSNNIDIELNSSKTFVNFPITSSDSVYLKKVLVHELGHGFLARHTVNRSIMYKNGFFENISSLTSDDHLCGEHSFKLGVNGPPCNMFNPPMNLNIGEFDCLSNSISRNSKLSFDIYPNPTKDFFDIAIQEDYNIHENLNIIIFDISGRIIFKNENISQLVDVSALTSGLYYVQILDNNIVLASEKLIIHD